MARNVEFDPGSDAWDDSVEGHLWRIRSDRGASGPPWRCTLRWMSGGWTQIVGIEFGPAVIDDFDFGFDESGRANATTVQGPVPLTALGEGPVIRAVREVFHKARDIETARVVASAARTIEPDEDQGMSFVQQLQGKGHRLHAGIKSEDHQVRLAAYLYDSFLDREVPYPTQAVADVLDMSRATAARRIKAARERGYLGPALTGKAGGRMSEEKRQSKERQ